MHVAGGPFVRFDTWLVTGTKVTPYYDSLSGKLIVYAKTREECEKKLAGMIAEKKAEIAETKKSKPTKKQG